MTRRPASTSVIHSKKFLITAGISAVAAGAALGVASGIIPARVLTEAWGTYERKSPPRSVQTAPRGGGERLPRGPEGGASDPGSASGNGSVFSKRLFGRLAALFTKTGGGENSSPRAGGPAHPPAEEFNAPGAPQPGGGSHYSGAPGPGAGRTPPNTPALDSREFGVGSVGLGLGGNGGPITAQSLENPGTPSETSPEFDSYFDPEEPIPQVKSARAANKNPAKHEGASAPEGAVDGAGGAANAAAGASRVGFGGARETAAAHQDTAADYSRQKTADDAWADKKGGADLKTHKLKAPELGGGKGIRNAPSRTR